MTGNKRPSDYDLFAKERIFERVSRRSASKSDITKARSAHQLRSPRARGVDESMTKNVTNIFDVWASDPARYDMMGVDTKKPKAKRGSRK